MKHLLLATTALVSTLSSPVLAQISGPPSSRFSWTGFYVGANAGYLGFNDTFSQHDGGSGCITACGAASDHGNGAVGGGQLGYNWQMGSFVLGIEADLGAAVASSRSGDENFTRGSRLSALGTLRGRVGYAFSDMLLYATGGLATARMGRHASDQGSSALWESDGWRAGWTAGAGLERKLAGNWSLKIEALYYRLNAHSTNHHDPGYVDPAYGTVIEPPRDYPAAFESEGVVARIGLNLNFGSAAGPVPSRF